MTARTWIAVVDVVVVDAVDFVEIKCATDNYWNYWHNSLVNLTVVVAAAGVAIVAAAAAGTG